MNKKILLLALLPAGPAFAQSRSALEETRPEPVLTAQAQQIRNKELALTLLNAGKEEPVYFSSPETLARLKEYTDYFPAEELLDGRTDPKIPHESSIVHFTGTRLNLEGIQYEDLDGYEIHDRYSIKAGYELPGDFQYNNTYFLYRDKEGRTLATIIYMECTIGGMKTEYRVVKKGLSALLENTLSLSPNPAGRQLTITSRITRAGHYSLSITGLEGRNLVTVFDKRQLTEGIYSYALTPDLPAGTYLVVLQAAHAAPVTQKLIIK